MNKKHKIKKKKKLTSNFREIKFLNAESQSDFFQVIL